MKHYASCSRDLPIGDFRPLTGSRSKNVCRACEKEWQAAYRLLHPERERLASSRWKRKHPSVINAKNRRAYASLSSEAKQARRFRVNGRIHHRRAGGMATGVSYEQWLELLKRQGGRCFYCNDNFSTKRTPTLDHVIPLSKGGQHNQSNAVAACLSCNSRKGVNVIVCLLP